MIKIIVIVIVICVILYLFFTSDYSKSRRAQKNVDKSCGTFDKAAQDALEDLAQIADLSPRDKNNRARILNLNMYNGEHDPREEQPADTTMRRQIALAAANDYTDIINDDLGMMDDDILYNTIMFGENIMDDPALQNIGEYIVGGANTRIKDSLAARLTEVKTESVKDKKMDKFVEISTKHTSDAQNTHDGAVNTNLRRTLQTLRKDHGDLSAADVAETLDEIRACAQTFKDKTYPHTLYDVLDKVAAGNYISTYDETESRILAYVWGRSKHHSNVANKQAMQKAVLDALHDCVENGSIVCINGRAARIMSSLVLLDADKSVGSALTYETYRNEIFNETRQIMKSVAETIAKTDPLYDAAQSYSDPDHECTPADERALADRMFNAVSNNLDNYRNKLSANDFERIKSECKAAVYI